MSAVGFAQTNYDYSRIQREKLGRGVVAIRENDGRTMVSWRYLSTDPMQTSFNVYRNGTLITPLPIALSTSFYDTESVAAGAVYEVRPVVGGVETRNGSGVYSLPANAPMGYLDIPLEKPADGVTPAGDKYSYAPGDASVADVDGDGEFEIILKWDPSNAHDNAHDGYTGNVFIDCYKMSGKKLWRIDLGHNVRAGAHYTQFMVYDFDGDGKAEVVMKTSDGTVDGVGKVIGNAKADYREKGLKRKEAKEAQKNKEYARYNAPRNGAQRQPMNGGRRPQGNWKPTPVYQGRIFTGNEFLSIFNGETGAEMQTIDYVPQRGNMMDWGDNHANRCERYLACVAYLDGIHPSVVMCRGYYTRMVLAAFDWDGKQLKQRWVFDSDKLPGRDYHGQGNHNLRVGDVDGDGCDEIIYGSCAFDHDGKGMYSTRLGHGDAMHMTAFIPGSDRLQVWECHEGRKCSELHDAATGKLLFDSIPGPDDVGRCMAADIDPTNPGLEMWSSFSYGIRNYKGEVINKNQHGLPVNMGVWWDGDLLREMLNYNRVSKYDWNEGVCKPLQTFEGAMSINGTKAVPCIQGDLLGDWREEVLLRANDGNSLRLYVSTIPTEYRFHTFLEDPVYRLSLVYQNVAYNQPTQVGFYFGAETAKPGTTFRGWKFE